MAAPKDTFAPGEMKVMQDALSCYRGEVKKVMVKAEKLGLKEAEALKQKYLLITALTEKVNQMV